MILAIQTMAGSEVACSSLGVCLRFATRPSPGTLRATCFRPALIHLDPRAAASILVRRLTSTLRIASSPITLPFLEMDRAPVRTFSAGEADGFAEFVVHLSAPGTQNASARYATSSAT